MKNKVIGCVIATISAIQVLIILGTLIYSSITQSSAGMFSLFDTVLTYFLSLAIPVIFVFIGLYIKNQK